MPITSTPVLVTGITGFIAAEIAKQLLNRGYLVRGTTRDVARAREDGFITSLPGADQRLELVEADLDDPGAFDDAVESCEQIMHVASPYVLDVEDPQRNLVDPAVNGTVSVLASAAKSSVASRVILTSSFAAVAGAPKDGVWTEDDWNDVSTIESGPYPFSKTMAEGAAWDYVESNTPGFDLVVINPTGVIGPSIVPRLNQSATLFTSLTNGSVPGIISLDFAYVDVRDVAKAHVLAMETPSASGRYLCSAATVSTRHIVELMKEQGFGDRYRLPSISLDNAFGMVITRLVANFQPKGTRDFIRKAIGKTYHLDTTKIRTELGLEFRDIDQTLIEALEDLEKWGHLGKKQPVGELGARG